MTSVACSVSALSGLDQALDLAGKGWHVLPCLPDKKPRIEEWPNRATTDPETVRGWWKMWPDALVGVAPGKSGHTVIDIDKHDGKVSGFASAILAGAPVEARTQGRSIGGDGLHLWYRGLNQTCSKVNGIDQVDSRSVGGYAVIVYDLPPAAEVTEALPAVYYAEPSDTARAEATRPEVQAWLDAHQGDMSDRLRRYVEDTANPFVGNDNLNTRIVSIVRSGNEGHGGATEALGHLSALWAKAEHGEGNQGAQALFENTLRSAIGKYAEHVDPPEPPIGDTPQAPNPVAVEPIEPKRDYEKENYADAGEPDPRSTRRGKDTTRRLNRTSLGSVEIERQRWAVADQIPLGTVTILAGTAGIAKSTILAWYVAGINHGTLEGDLQGIPSQVAMINGEDDLSTVLKPRLVAAGANTDLVTSLSSVTISEGDRDWITSPNLADDMHAIYDALVETGAKMLIIDPIISLMQGDSHRLEDVRKNLDPLAGMAADLDVAIVCVAHFNKGGGNASEKVSGSHAFRDIARSLLLLVVDDETDERILTVEKSNYSPRKPSLAFQVDSVSVPTSAGDVAVVGKATFLGHANVTVQDILARDTTPLGERSTDLIEYVNQHPEGVTPDQAAEALGTKPNETRVYLSRAVSAGRIARPTRGVYAPLRSGNATPNATPPHTVASVTSVANELIATLATDTTPSAGVANSVAFPDPAPIEPSCRVCGQLLSAPTSKTSGICAKKDQAHTSARAA